MHDTPEAIAITDKAAQDLMLSELLKVCTQGNWFPDFAEAYRVRSKLDGGNILIMTNLKGKFGTSGRRSGKEVAANTKLVALAPTIAAELIKERALNAMLLEALKDVCQAYLWLTFGEARGWSESKSFTMQEALEKARTVIKKAEGVQP
jgi:hypothetical protein